MKYFLNAENGDLIQYNPDTWVYKIRNRIERVNHVLEKVDILKLNLIPIKKDKFSQFMNISFKTVEHEWEFEGRKYRKLPNFEANERCLSNNYRLGVQVPYHEIEGKKWLGKVVLVYHWGKVYYHTISYGGYKQGQLVDTKTFELVRWAQLKHCSPILDIDNRKII